VACHFVKVSARGKQWKQKYASKHGKGKAMAVLAAKLGRSVYHLLRKEEAFDEERFWNSGAGSWRKESAVAQGVKTRS
jgi:hypothetical protein